MDGSKNLSLYVHYHTLPPFYAPLSTTVRIVSGGIPQGMTKSIEVSTVTCPSGARVKTLFKSELK
jgi:hypothetical protein